MSRCRCAEHYTERPSILCFNKPKRNRVKRDFPSAAAWYSRTYLISYRLSQWKKYRNKLRFYTCKERETLPDGHPFINANVRGFSAYEKLILQDTDICAVIKAIIFRNANICHVFLKFSVNCTMWIKHSLCTVNNMCCLIQGYNSCNCQHK